MSELKLKGKIKLINETQTWDSGFSKREFVITTPEQYPQDIKLEVVKDKCNVLENYAIGDDVDVSFNIRGNEYNGNYYVNLQAWKINKIASSQPVEKAPKTEPKNMVEDDSLPF